MGRRSGALPGLLLTPLLLQLLLLLLFAGSRLTVEGQPQSRPSCRVGLGWTVGFKGVKKVSPHRKASFRIGAEVSVKASGWGTATTTLDDVVVKMALPEGVRLSWGSSSISGSGSSTGSGSRPQQIQSGQNLYWANLTQARGGKTSEVWLNVKVRLLACIPPAPLRVGLLAYRQGPDGTATCLTDAPSPLQLRLKGPVAASLTNCTSPAPDPSPAPYRLVGVNEGLAPAVQVPITPARARDLGTSPRALDVSSPTVTDACNTGCAYYYNGSTPFFFEVTRAGSCFCCQGSSCRIIYQAGSKTFLSESTVPPLPPTTAPSRRPSMAPSQAPSSASSVRAFPGHTNNVIG